LALLVLGMTHELVANESASDESNRSANGCASGRMSHGAADDRAATSADEAAHQAALLSLGERAGTAYQDYR
jgi:hypothetical protein